MCRSRGTNGCCVGHGEVRFQECRAGPRRPKLHPSAKPRRFLRPQHAAADLVGQGRVAGVIEGAQHAGDVAKRRGSELPLAIERAGSPSKSMITKSLPVYRTWPRW